MSDERSRLPESVEREETGADLEARTADANPPEAAPAPAVTGEPNTSGLLRKIGKGIAYFAGIGTLAGVVTLTVAYFAAPDTKAPEHQRGSIGRNYDKVDNSKFLFEFDYEDDGAFDGPDDVTYIIDPKAPEPQRLATRQAILDVTSDYHLKMRNLGERPNGNARFEWLYKMHDRTATINRGENGFDADDNRRILVIPADPMTIKRGGEKFLGIPMKPSHFEPNYGWEEGFHDLRERRGEDVYGRPAPDEGSKK